MSLPDILYVEDEEDFQLLVQRILTRAGLGVRLTSTGAEGLAAVRTKRPDLLILDINLPDADGYAICRQLREDPAYTDLPILMLTVRRRPEEWLRGFSSGATDYISKPINPPDLVERVLEALQEKSAALPKEGSPEYRLLQAAIAGNRSAFQVLIEQYRTRLMNNALLWVRNELEAEEVVSRAFVVAYDKMHYFRGESLFFTWLYRIAMHELVNMRRRTPSLSLDLMTCDGELSTAPQAFVADDASLSAITRREDAHRAREALLQVPQPYRRLLDLFFMQEFSYETISKRLHMPMGTVMSRLHKARRLLQEAWEKRTPTPT
jgi:RNA polymerase sigma factor (sigma-70 family)